MTHTPDDTEGPRLDRSDVTTARARDLIAMAEELAGELSLRPLLERILRRCTELLGCAAGSVCSVDEVAGTYRKEADIGIACQSGQVFPLTEGMTGAVVARRKPVWFDRYDQVPGGHLAAPERACLRAVIGVPLQWRARIIGVCIVFSLDERRVFGPHDAELLQLFAQHAGIALATARMHEAAEERARAEAAAAERDRVLGELHDTLTRGLAGVQAHLGTVAKALAEQQAGAAAGELAAHVRQAAAGTTEVMAQARRTLSGLAAPPARQDLAAALASEAGWAETTGGLEARLVLAGTPVPVQARLARELTGVAREALAAIVRQAGARSVRIGLLYDAGGVTLLVQDDGQGGDATPRWPDGQPGLRTATERAREIGASVSIDALAGWGTRVRARFPYEAGEPGAGAPRLRVLVAARHPVLRSGLARLLTWAEPGVEVVSEVATADETIEACRELEPDVALAEFGVISPETIGALLAAQPQLAVVGLCEAGDDERVADVVRAGARGCVDIGVTGPELAQAVVAAGRGQAMLSDVALRELHRGLRADDTEQVLTEREREVRGLMEQGLPDRVIAQQLGVSVKTVEKHAGAVLRKTGARNRTELAARASRSRSW